MSKPTLKQLKEQLTQRWNEESIDEVSRWLYAKMKGPCPSGEVEIEGLAFADLRGYRALGGEVPRGVSMQHVDMSFGELNFNTSVFRDCIFVRTEWGGGYVGHLFERCDFTRAQCRQSNLVQAIFIDCKMEGINLQRIFAGRGTSFHRCDLTGAYFTEAGLGVQGEVSVTFTECCLNQARFGSRSPLLREDEEHNAAYRGGQLSGVSFVACTFHDVDWGGADTSTAEFLPEDTKPIYV
ncbi:MAG: pentapeptide repeat-containing protein [Planctomycetota bacterium]